MFTICGDHYSDGYMCITYEDGTLTGGDEITQLALDIHLKYWPFVLSYQGKVFDVVDDPTIDEQRAFFFILQFLAGPTNKDNISNLSVTPDGYFDSKAEEWFGPVEEGVLY